MGEYETCYCRHFYTEIYDRNYLSRDDHTNLLATPKGYRWYGPEGSPRTYKREFRSRTTVRRREPPPPFPSFRQFMVEIWSIMTPELIQSLKDILEEEFGMSSTQAIQFLIDQKKKAERLAELEEYGRPWVTDDAIVWACATARTLARKITQYTEMMATTKRNRRTSALHKNLVKAMQRTFGIQPGDDTPLKRLMARMAEGTAVWAASIPGETDVEKVCNELVAVYSSVSLI